MKSEAWFVDFCHAPIDNPTVSRSVHRWVVLASSEEDAVARVGARYRDEEDGMKWTGYGFKSTEPTLVYSWGE